MILFIYIYNMEVEKKKELIAGLKETSKNRKVVLPSNL